MRSSSVAAVLTGLSLVVASGLYGCESESEPGGGGGGTTDAGVIPDGAANEGGGGTSDGGGGDGGSNGDAGDAGDGGDTGTVTNDSTWSAATGLPQAACTPWTLVDTADPEEPALSGGKLTIATSADGENMYYVQKALITPAELVIEARLRLVSGTASTASRAPAVVGFHYGADKRKNLLMISDGEVFLLSEENTKAGSAAVATSDAMHTYKIVANTTTHAITVFRDGASILTGTAFQEVADPGAVVDIFFGEGSSFATGTSEWESFKHNAHAPTTCP